MISFKQFLTEIFNGSNIEVWKTIYPSDPILVEFSIRGEKFTVAIIKRIAGNIHGDQNLTYTIAFDRDGRLNLVGNYDTKTAIRVYSTVIDIIKTKLKPIMNTGDEIDFQSFDSRTNKVYERFSKIAAREMNGTYKKNGNTFRITKL